MSAPVDVFRDLLDTLPMSERLPLHFWLALAERMLDPLPPVRPVTYVSAAERVRRARLPRPNPYYPGDRDYLGETT